LRKKVLRRIFESERKKEKVRERWRKLNNKEFHNFYWSPNSIRMTKSRIIRAAAHVARIEEMRNSYEVLVEKPEWTKHFGDLSID
jgi:hypothetical protein